VIRDAALVTPRSAPDAAVRYSTDMVPGAEGATPVVRSTRPGTPDMRHVRLLTLALLLACGSARADGIDLAWNDCRGTTAASASLTVACANAATEQFVAAFRLAAPVDSVVAVEVVIDVLAPGALRLPEWWAYAPGGCRDGALVASANFGGMTGCADWLGGAATFDSQPVYAPGAPRGAANTARIVATFAVLSSQARTLAPGTSYYATRFTIQNDNGVCPGCTAPVCLLLESVRLLRVRGDDRVLDVPSAMDANQIMWQSTTASCATVPARRTSWGMLRQLYR